ncbi:hypothetical protein EYF80_007042 [Liparis tanakae]|uniref:Uncharacterized protein n=1 Tax=Liparis tanakae TaxID=230148 RepID=A0A4Z2IYF0_9TELE|nr:hypothetical protein EYF80_007042 [Liparis tanakae]
MAESGSSQPVWSTLQISMISWAARDNGRNPGPASEPDVGQDGQGEGEMLMVGLDWNTQVTEAAGVECLIGETLGHSRNAGIALGTPDAPLSGERSAWVAITDTATGGIWGKEAVSTFYEALSTEGGSGGAGECGEIREMQERGRAKKRGMYRRKIVDLFTSPTLRGRPANHSMASSSSDQVRTTGKKGNVTVCVTLVRFSIAPKQLGSDLELLLNDNLHVESRKNSSTGKCIQGPTVHLVHRCFERLLFLLAVRGAYLRSLTSTNSLFLQAMAEERTAITTRHERMNREGEGRCVHKDKYGEEKEEEETRLKKG